MSRHRSQNAHPLCPMHACKHKRLATYCYTEHTSSNIARLLTWTARRPDLSRPLYVLTFQARLPDHYHPLRRRRQLPLTPTRTTRRRWRHLQLRILRHHPLEPNPHTLNNRQQNRTTNCTIPYRLWATPNRERATGKETRDDGVPGVLLLADAFDGTVECAEHAAPDTEVAAEDGRAGFDCCDGWM